MADDISPDETAEEFQARYPRPGSPETSTRVLVRCWCDFLPSLHWGWGSWFWDLEDGGLMHNEELAEDVPTRG